MQNIIVQISAIIQNLSPQEIIIIIIITAFLLLYLVYRKLGLGVAVVLLAAYIFAYIVYSNKLLDFYKGQDIKNTRYQKQLEEELK